MKETIFKYAKGYTRKMAWRFLGLGILGGLISLYMWLWAQPVLLVALVGGIFLAILGVAAFIKLMFSQKKENQIAIRITTKGIQADTTPVAKAAGMIAWVDVERVHLSAHFLNIRIENTDKYAQRMQSFFVRDTFLKMLKGTVRISVVETNATYDELLRVLQKYATQSRIEVNK